MSTNEHTAQLMEAAAETIRTSAMALKRSHTSPSGVWTICDNADQKAMIEYLHDIRLARQLNIEAERIRKQRVTP